MVENEYNRVSALKIGKYNKPYEKMYYRYLPQVEICTFCPATGIPISSEFILIGVKEFSNEIDAIKYAIDWRNNNE